MQFGEKDGAEGARGIGVDIGVGLWVSIDVDDAINAHIKVGSKPSLTPSLKSQDTSLKATPISVYENGFGLVILRIQEVTACPRPFSLAVLRISSSV
eukprot:1157173-Pelagomonas_calceolata.AAC.2